jgi:hypothetical protein
MISEDCAAFLLQPLVLNINTNSTVSLHCYLIKSALNMHTLGLSTAERKKNIQALADKQSQIWQLNMRGGVEEGVEKHEEEADGHEKEGEEEEGEDRGEEGVRENDAPIMTGVRVNLEHVALLLTSPHFYSLQMCGILYQHRDSGNIFPFTHSIFTVARTHTYSFYLKHIPPFLFIYPYGKTT